MPRSRFLFRCFAVAAGVLAATAGSAHADSHREPLNAHATSPVQAPSASAGDLVPGRFIVTYSDDSTAAERRSALAAISGETVRDRIGRLDVAVLDLSRDARAAAVRVLRADPAVERVEPDVRLRAFHVDCRSNTACSLPSDPAFPYQWGLQNDPATVLFTGPSVYGADIAAPLAWKQSLGNATTRVAVLDTGVDVNHEDLAGRVVFTATAYNDGGVDVRGHGTHVAGIIGATQNNGVGLSGVAPQASLLNIKTLDDTGATSCAIASDAIVYAADLNVDIINASFGTATYCSTLENAVNYAWNRDTLVVASAGNSGTTAANYPAAFANALSVAATTNTDVRAPFSNHGTWVSMAAPGVDIVSSTPGGYSVGSGTSQSAPYVSGVAALIWPSVPDSDSDGFRSDDVAYRLLRYSDPVAGTGTEWKFGRLNACRALTADTGLCPPPAPAPPPPPPPAPAPTPAPAATAPPGAASAALTRSAAKRAANRALASRYKKTWRKGRAKKVNCRVAEFSSEKGRCNVSWRYGRYRYKGTVQVQARTSKSPRTKVAVRRLIRL